MSTVSFSIGPPPNRAPPAKPMRKGLSTIKLRPTPERAAMVVQRWWRYYHARNAYLRIKKQIARRNKIVQEILSTEQSYVNSLQTLSKVFLQPLEDSHLADDYFELKTLFGGIKVIIGYNKILLEELNNIVPRWTNRSKLGDLFLRMIAFLKAYTQYVNTYKSAIDCFEKLKTSKHYVEWEGKIDKTECGGLQLGDYLIMPIQRIPRYNMLLEDLYKNTWAFHIDYENLKQAHTKIKDIANFVNSSQREAENLRKVTEIAAEVSNQGSKLDTLIVPWRRYVFDGPLTIAEDGKQCHMYLFNDSLLIAKPKKEKKIFDKMVDLLTVSIVQEDVPPLNFGIKEANVVTLYLTKSEYERKKWIDSFQEAMIARSELKYRTDEIVPKNRQNASNATPGDSTEKADDTRDRKLTKTLSAGNLHLLKLPRILIDNVTSSNNSEEHNSDEIKKTHSDIEKENSDDEPERPLTERRKTMKRTASLKGLSFLSSGDKKSSLSGLLSPRVNVEATAENTTNTKPKTKSDFFAPQEESTGRNRGISLATLWNRDKKSKKTERERRNSDASAEQNAPEASASAPACSSPHNVRKKDMSELLGDVNVNNLGTSSQVSSPPQPVPTPAKSPSSGLAKHKKSFGSFFNKD